MQNMPERSNEQDAIDARGPVADALHNAKAELDNQITEQEKAKSDIDLALQRAMQDKEEKENELEKAMEWYNYWITKHAQLQDTISNISSKIDGLTSLSNSQQTELDRLRAAAAAKHNAAKMAKDLEDLIISLTDQIAQKDKLLADTKVSQATKRQNQQADCDAAIQKFTDSIANLTSSINAAQAELDLLTELHTERSCAGKEAKNERICKRCTAGEPCGDTCISANKTCHHDLGCACKDEDASSLLETEPAEDDDTHPLQTQLRNAKAELRKIIAQHQQTIDSLSTDIKENEDKQKKLTTEKQGAMEDYDNSLKEL